MVSTAVARTTNSLLSDLRLHVVATRIGRVSLQDVQVEPQELLLELVESQVRKLIEPELERLLPRVHPLHEMHVFDEHRQPLGLLVPLEIKAVLRHPRLEQAQHATIASRSVDLASVVEDRK